MLFVVSKYNSILTGVTVSGLKTELHLDDYFLTVCWLRLLPQSAGLSFEVEGPTWECLWGRDEPWHDTFLGGYFTFQQHSTCFFFFTEVTLIQLKKLISATLMDEYI